MLVTRPRKRAGFALGFLLLLGAAVVGFDASKDFSASRAPLTILSFALTAACLGGALSTRATAVTPGARRISTERRLAGIRIGGESFDLVAGSGLRITRPGGERGPYSLELNHRGGVAVLDSSSWLSELEPVGRRIAETLSIPFSAPRPPGGGVAGRGAGMLR